VHPTRGCLLPCSSNNHHHATIWLGYTSSRRLAARKSSARPGSDRREHQLRVQRLDADMAIRCSLNDSQRSLEQKGSSAQVRRSRTRRVGGGPNDNAWPRDARLWLRICLHIVTGQQPARDEVAAVDDDADGGGGDHLVVRRGVEGDGGLARAWNGPRWCKSNCKIYDTVPSISPIEGVCRPTHARPATD
jgi:hypothetical protein